MIWHGGRDIACFNFVTYELILSNLLQFVFFIHRAFDGHITMLMVQVLLARYEDAAGGGDVQGKTSILMPCWSNIPCI